MKNVKILHLYPDALDLYGDYKNLSVLKLRLSESGNGCEIVCANIGDELTFSGYDMVYIGHGKARNLAAVSEHFVKYKESIISSIESGTLWFATGNSRELFGKSFPTPDGEVKPGIALFDYEGVETNKVFVCDMLAEPNFETEEQCYGFANRTAYLKGENKYPLFRVISGFSDGDVPVGSEGTLYKNFFATWGMGPMLSRNPALLKEFLKRLLGEVPKECDFSLETAANKAVCAEFKGE